MRLRLLRLGFLMLLLFFFSNTTWAMEVLLKDQWMIVEQDNKPVGIRHYQSWRTDTGYKYNIDLALQTNSPDALLTQNVEHWELLTDKSFLAKSCKAISDINGYRNLFNADFTSTLVKTKLIDSNGKEIINSYSLETPLYFFHSFIDSLYSSGKIQVGKANQVPLFDIDKFIPYTYSYTIDKTATYKYLGKNLQLFVLTEPTDQNPSSLIDAKGECYWCNSSKQRLSYRKIEKTELPDLKTPLFPSFLIPGNTKVVSPQNSISSQVHLSWKDLKMNELKFEDNRQKITNHKESTLGNELWISINQDNRDFTGKVTLPVKDQSLIAFLAKEPYILPAIPAIKKQTGEILADVTDGWLATQKLVHWVHDNLKPGIHNQLWSIDQILDKRTANTIEYSILFASMARSAGLPTRMIWGERYQDGAWIEHVWNEVWLGGWVAVDSYNDQVAPGSLLLKLVDSDTTQGILKYRNSLIGNLGIYIEELQLAEPTTLEIDTLKTGIYGRTYLNGEYHCRIKVPEDWQLIETTEHDLPVLIIQSQSNKDVTGILTIQSNIMVSSNGETVIKTEIPELQDALSQYQLTKQQLGTTEAGLIQVANKVLENDPFKFRQQNWLMLHENTAYLLIFLAPDDQYPNYETDFQKIREQFKVTIDNLNK